MHPAFGQGTQRHQNRKRAKVGFIEEALGLIGDGSVRLAMRSARCVESKDERRSPPKSKSSLLLSVISLSGFQM